MARLLRNYMQHHETFGSWNIPNLMMTHPMPTRKSWHIQMNSIGMRDSREFEIQKPSDTGTRVTVLGDSFTFGHSVDVEERFTNILETILPSAQFLNFGLCSAGLDQQYLIHRDLASKYESDILLLTPDSRLQQRFLDCPFDCAQGDEPYWC